jgi:hypothetical protein
VSLKKENVNMKKLYIATGYNSYTNKEIRQAFNSEAEADKFLDGLTDPRIQVIAYKSTVELINHLLKGST